MTAITVDDVTIASHPTKKGQRLRVATAEASVDLDAIQVESIAWQDREALAAFLDLPRDADADVVAAEATDAGASVRLANEYATVELTEQTTPAGDRVYVESLKLGYEAHVGADLLAGVAETDSTEFREFLDEPFGPGNEETH